MLRGGPARAAREAHGDEAMPLANAGRPRSMPASASSARPGRRARCSWSPRTPSTGPRSSGPGKRSTPGPSASRSPRAPGSRTTRAGTSWKSVLDPEEARPWRFNAGRAGGGIVIDGGSHWIRPLRMWLGEVDAVVATVGRPLHQMEGESLAHALLRFRSGKTATFEAFYGEGIFGPSELWRITGLEGEIAVSRLGRRGAVQRRPPGRGATDGAGRVRGLLRPRTGRLRPRRPRRGAPAGRPRRPQAGPEESLGELRTALAIYRSAASGGWEDVW